MAPPIVRLTDAVDDTNREQTPASPEPTEPGPAGTHVVEPGDSLWRIAQRALVDQQSGEPTSADIARFWPRIYDANRSLIGADPNLIFPGQHLEIPEV